MTSLEYLPSEMVSVIKGYPPSQRTLLTNDVPAYRSQFVDVYFETLDDFRLSQRRVKELQAEEEEEEDLVEMTVKERQAEEIGFLDHFRWSERRLKERQAERDRREEELWAERDRREEELWAEIRRRVKELQAERDRREEELWAEKLRSKMEYLMKNIARPVLIDGNSLGANLGQFGDLLEMRKGSHGNFYACAFQEIPLNPKSLDKKRDTLKQKDKRSGIWGNTSFWKEGKYGAENVQVKTNQYGKNEKLTVPQSSTKGQGQKIDHSSDHQKKILVQIVSGSVSESSLGHQNGRVDIHVGDTSLQIESIRQELGIRDVISIHKITLPSDAANDPDSKLLVRMRPYGEGKDSWEHCATQDGDVGLPEVQPLYISHIMRGYSAFPASATWLLETPDKCTPSSVLEAELEIELVTSSMKHAKDSRDSSGSPFARLSIQVHGRKYPEVITRSKTPLLGSNTEQISDTLEEKYQSEPMEK